MSKELKKRLITSIILFLLAIFCIFAQLKVFIISILIISFIGWYESTIISYKIFKKLKIKDLLFKIITFYYFFGIFAASSISIYKSISPNYFFYILCICISSDIGGYIIGSNLQGRKLTKISPNKTISGSFGSFAFSILPLIIFNIFHNEYLFSSEDIFFCIMISFVTQLGDIIISYFKRKAKIKDTGNILPGHGGFLDRIDGIILAIPFTQIIILGLLDFNFFNYFKL
jgi:phosphatidate cytidylyltransferase